MKPIQISDITIGVRHRRDLGDVNGLASSISEVGLLHPIVVRSDGTLIAGERRLAACKLLGWNAVPVTVVDMDEIVRGEFAENADRKDFLPTEIDAIRRALEPVEKIKAKKRQGKRNDLCETFAQDGKQRASDKIGAFAGVSGRTVEKIAKVVEAAEKQPEKFGHLVEELDRTGKVDAAYSKVRRHERHEKIAEKASAVATLPDQFGPFPVIYADPPWKWGHFGDINNENEQGKGRTPDQHYPTLTYDEIKSFAIVGRGIKDIAHRDAALFLWCTSANIVHALDVMEAWGFTYKAHAAWVKMKEGQLQSGTGLVFRNCHELLLYGTRGDMPGPQHQPRSVFIYPRTTHSAKPPEIRIEIEKMFPNFDANARLELFARETVTGWTPYGFESQNKAA